MTTTEAARRIGCHPSRVRQLLGDGVLSGERVGRDWLVTKESVESFRKLPKPTKGRPRGGRPAKRRKS